MSFEMCCKGTVWFIACLESSSSIKSINYPDCYPCLLALYSYYLSTLDSFVTISFIFSGETCETMLIFHSNITENSTSLLSYERAALSNKTFLSISSKADLTIMLNRIKLPRQHVSRHICLKLWPLGFGHLLCVACW